MKKLIKSLVLIGFQASGKTTLGQELANHLQCTFVDTDRLMEQFHPTLSSREIFQDFGSSYFRNLESQVIFTLKDNPPLVVATGGGSLLKAYNGERLKAYGLLIYLKTSADILKRRIWERPELPVYLDQANFHHSFLNLYQERTLLYEKWADRILEMDQLNEKEALKLLLQIVNEMSSGEKNGI